VIDWFRRPQSLPAKTVADFTLIVRDQKLESDYERGERINALLQSEDLANLEEIAKLLGQPGNNSKL
jgi:hypothetical protein